MQVFDLMAYGLKQQRAMLDMRPAYSRIVRSDENLHDVLAEAIEHGAYVWANSSKQRTCINTSMPNGEGWVKVHGTYSMPVIQQFVESADDDTFPPDAA